MFKFTKVESKQVVVNPQQAIILGFAITIIIGTFLLNLPIATKSGQSIGFINAFFTAASSVCVTGLTVVDIGSTFSIFGQIVMLTLIQIGGLGFMTFGVVIAILLGKKIGLKQRLLIQQFTNSVTIEGIVRLAISIFLIAFILEIVGAIILAIHWSNDMGWSQSSYYAIFHAISAFNNAGFTLWPNNLQGFIGDPVVILVISMLFVLGGLGFMVILDVFRKRKWRTLTLHSKLSLFTTGILIIVGFVTILSLEWMNAETLQPLSVGDKLWTAYFQGVVPRTSGFSNVPVGGMMAGSQLIIIILMFIGASSGSTGGGIKTSTFSVLVLGVINITKGRKDIQVFHRRIAMELMLRALAVIMISLSVVLIATILLTISEDGAHGHFMKVLFEVVSAFSTSGGSMGLTNELSTFGKFVIIATMFIGRLGPLTLAFALAQKKEKTLYSYVEEKVLIG